MDLGAIMSKVNEFITLEQNTGLPGAVYLSRLQKPTQSAPQWPRGNSIGRAEASNKPASAPVLGLPALPAQIRGAISSYYRFIGQTPSRKSVDRHVKQLSGYYTGLKKLGFDIQDVSTFGLRHAKALLEKWQSSGCASNTVYVRWSELRTWSRVLGKHGMLSSLAVLQPGFDRRPQFGENYRVLTTAQIASRSDFLSSKTDLTAYLVDRLCRELGLTREEALQLELDAVNQVVERESAVLHVGFGHASRNVLQVRLRLDLIMQVRDFMLSRNRKSLAWSNLDPDAALQKYSLRLSYVNRCLFKETKGDGVRSAQIGGAA
jgi:hypothetical protein